MTQKLFTPLEVGAIEAGDFAGFEAKFHADRALGDIAQL